MDLKAARRGGIGGWIPKREFGEQKEDFSNGLKGSEEKTVFTEDVE